MSERKARFRIKKGDIEIEFEGDATEVNARYEKAFEWIRTSVTSIQGQLEASLPKEEKKEKKRGGSRSNVISRAIDSLIEEGYFDGFKKIPEVIEELKRRTVPGAYYEAVVGALNRRVPEKLDRVKDTDGKWTYRRKKK